jgi:hypothetical protein
VNRAPDPRLELLGLGFGLELGDHVRLGQLDLLGLVVVVPLAAGGRVWAAPPPGVVNVNM